MKAGRDIVTMPRDEYYRNYYAREALAIIQHANESKPLTAEHLEALLSFPAIAYDWNLIMQHPSLQLMSYQERSDLVEVIGQLNVQRSSMITNLNLEKDKLWRLARVVAADPVSEQRGMRRGLGN